MSPVRPHQRSAFKLIRIFCPLLLSVLVAYAATAVLSAICGERYTNLALEGLGRLTPQDDFQLLKLGEPVERGMAGGETHTYRVYVESGRYLLVCVEQQAMNVSVTLYAPDGRRAADSDSPSGAYGPEYVSVVAESAGDYRVELKSTEKWVNPGRYTIRVEELRAVAPADEKRVAAEKALSEGRLEYEKASPDAYRAAAKRFEEARALWEELDDPHGQAVSLYNLARTYRRLRDLKQAGEKFAAAATLRPRLSEHDWRLVASILNDSGVNYTDAGETQKALGALNDALRLFTENRDRRGQASALGNLGVTYASMGQLRAALDYYQKALPLRRAENDKAGEVNVLNSIGGFYDEIGEPRAALEHYSGALEGWQKLQQEGELQDRSRIATGFNNVAAAYDNLGEWQNSLENYQQAIKIYRELKDRRGESIALNNMGDLYFALGNADAASQSYEEALRILRENAIQDPATEANILSHLGQLHTQQGNFNEAQRDFEAALTRNQRPRGRSGTLTDVGALYALRGEPLKALEFYEKALAIRREIGDRRGEAVTLHKMGEAHSSLGDLSKAADEFKSALALWEAVADRRGQALTLNSLARVERDRNDLAAALKRSEEALAIVEGLRTKVASQRLRTSYFATKQDYYELYIDVLMRLYNLDRSPEHAAAALQASERARARGLIDLLVEARADVRQGANVSLIQRQSELRQKLNAKEQALTRLLNSNSPEASGVLKEITQLVAEDEEFQARIKSSSPRYANLTQPPSLGLGDIQRELLDDNTLLLEFALGEERSYLWLVSRDSISAYTLPGRAEIENDARHFYEVASMSPRETPLASGAHTVTAPAPDGGYAVALSRKLLGQAAERLGKKRLLIVGDGMLQYIPFNALPSPRPVGIGEEWWRSAPYLVEEHEIVGLPSASSFAVLRKETAGRIAGGNDIVVLADPVVDENDQRIKRGRKSAPPPRKAQNTPSTGGDRATGLEGDLRPLLLTREEAEKIKAAAAPRRVVQELDFKASRATVARLEGRPHLIIHFATHGILNSTQPELSGLVLSRFDERGEPQVGVLRLHDIYNLKLPSEMVVLSACSTGLGGVIRGEGLIGLTRGFMYAGTPRVVASLWRIDDLATSELMERFYELILKKGMSPAAALRQAQTEMLKEPVRRAPYYWAPFVIQGEWNRIR